jgi:lipid-A-disaccharide synthase-like uncharacterized protein
MPLQFIDLLIFSFGFLAQFLFFSRNIVQWFKSEKAGKVLSPVLYWQISLIASVAMMVYGIFRTDPAIILGQFITFFIYIRNLQLQKAWKRIAFAFRVAITTMPFLCLSWVFLSGKFTSEQLLSGQKMPVWLMFFGIAAQLIFTFRFVFQWIISEKNKESSIPVGFWIFSISGASMTIFYAIMRLDPVLLLSNLGGLAMYSRNLILHFTGRGIFDLLPFDFTALKQKVIRRK